MTDLSEESWGQSEAEKATDALLKLCYELLDNGHPPEMVFDIAALWLCEIHTPNSERPLSRLAGTFPRIRLGRHEMAAADYASFEAAAQGAMLPGLIVRLYFWPWTRRNRCGSCCLLR